MCGFIGLVNYQNAASIADEMVQLQYHRGPDANAAYVFGPETYDVWMGHNRLAILDLSNASNQPIRSSDGRYAMVYNGEIYSYQSFGSYESDTLMLIDQISIHGFTPELLRRFEGMFSIAVFDSVENKIHLAVDPFGQKPLYYNIDGMKFAFASTPAALTILKDKWDLDREALSQMFGLGSVMGERSMFKGINKLPGSFMATFDINTGEFTKSQWWFMEPKPVSNIEELIIDSIEKVKVADVAVNIYLSGGIDSTLVATRFKGAKAIHLESEEQFHASNVATKEELDFQLCKLDFNKEQVLEEYARKTGDCAMSAVQPYIVSKEAKKFGKVAVIANGADELFYGYNRTHEDTQMEHIIRKGFMREDSIWDILPLYSEERRNMYYPYMQDAISRWSEFRFFIQNDLNKTLDFAAMCNSVEVRSPFLDSRLVNAAIAIPYSEHTSKQYGGKHILKSMLSKLGYSDQFLTRPKLGFSLPKHLQRSNEAELNWCIEHGFIDRKNLPKIKDKYYGRDIVYLSAAAASFKSWYNVWRNKLN